MNNSEILTIGSSGDGKPPYSNYQRRIAQCALALVVVLGTSLFVMLFTTLSKQDSILDAERLSHQLPDGMQIVPECVEGKPMIKVIDFRVGDPGKGVLVEEKSWPDGHDGNPCSINTSERT